MPQTIAAVSPRDHRVQPAPETMCVVRVRAELVSIRGGILLALGLLITAGCIVAIFSPSTNGLQQVIAIVLLIAVWMYVIGSATEELMVLGGVVVFQAKLKRTRQFPIQELEAMLVTHNGLNLERGMETIEFRVYNKAPERISLGPCWSAQQLDAFVHSVEQVMQLDSFLYSVEETVRDEG